MSTTTWPRLLVSTPAASRPSLSVNGLRPVATRTTSASTSVASPPAEGSTVSFTPVAVLTAPTTFFSIWNLNFCFLSARSNVLRICASIGGQMSFANSITVTWDPSRLHTLPSSRPMTPPPMTTMRLGTSFRSRAPVDVTMVSSSTSTPGKAAGSEPVARMTFLVLIVSVVPSSLATTTSPGLAVSEPQPFAYVTLFFLKSPSMPLVSPSTDFDFCSIILPTSMDTSPTEMPCLAIVWFASWNRCDAWRSALDGMHPTLRQVPPRVPRPSTQVTLRPSWAPLMAAT
mmetsp:Transcript_13818/g.37812  ORF Transcript_13818/g.37812 Transcript_13818/m.37812 type:complete len:286 (-) Transcript_13818:322-1179(-)